ncbi:MAG: hypothetical protein RLZZ15_4442, partial [Verrucomicrobiota bacterium]
PYFAEGASASGAGKEITLLRATVTYGEPGPWQPTLVADKIIYTPGQRLRTENSRAGVGRAQPLPLPHLTQNLRDPLTSFVTLNAGYRSSLGLVAEAGLHLPTAPGVMVGGELGVYTSRGVMVGPSGSYARGSGADAGGGDLRGSFRTGYINDHGDKKSDLLGRAVPENRGYIEWTHAQSLAENLTLTAQLNWWKDSEILRDFRPDAFYRVQQPDTFAEAAYAGRNYFVSVFTRLQPNNFSVAQERLPELRFDLLPTAIGGGFYERLNASAAVLRESAPLRQPRLQTTRLDAYYTLARPITHEDWLSFTPVGGARVTHYGDSKTANPRGAAATTRTLGELGFDAALRTSATFDYKNPLWKIDGLRHLFTPRLGYRFIPEADKNRARIPPIDREVFSTYLRPLGLGDTRNLDDLRATNTLRLGFDNTLQTRDATYGSRDLVTFNVANDFRLKRAPGERTASETHAELALTPVRWLEASVYQSVAPQSLTLREFNSALTLRDGEAWSLRFSNNFLRHQLHDYALDARARLNERFDTLVRLRYDARTRRFNEQGYGLVQNLANTWRLSYVVNLFSGPRRESRLGFSIQVDAIGFR